MRDRRKIGLGLVALLVGLVGAFRLVSGQGVEPQLYAPAMYYQPVPCPVDSGAIFDHEIFLPWHVLGGVEPIAVQDRSGTFFASVYRIDSGSNNGTWIVKWKKGDKTAVAIGATALFDAFDTAALPLTNSRGSIFVSYDRAVLYSIAWQDVSGGSRQPWLKIHRVLDYCP